MRGCWSLFKNKEVQNPLSLALSSYEAQALWEHIVIHPEESAVSKRVFPPGGRGMWEADRQQIGSDFLS